MSEQGQLATEERADAPAGAGAKLRRLASVVVMAGVHSRGLVPDVPAGGRHPHPANVTVSSRTRYGDATGPCWAVSHQAGHTAVIVLSSWLQVSQVLLTPLEQPPWTRSARLLWWSPPHPCDAP